MLRWFRRFRFQGPGWFSTAFLLPSFSLVLMSI